MNYIIENFNKKATNKEKEQVKEVLNILKNPDSEVSFAEASYLLSLKKDRSNAIDWLFHAINIELLADAYDRMVSLKAA